MNNNVVEYIRANRYIYTREAIDERLRAEGYTEDEIEDGWRQMPPLQPAPGQPVRASGWGSRGTLVGLSVFLVIVGIIVLGLTDLALGLSGGSPASGTWCALLAFVNLGSLILFVALMEGGNRLVREKGWSLGKLTGLVVAVAIVWYLIVVGTCLNGLNFLY
jgi:hypothetical protein